MAEVEEEKLLDEPQNEEEVEESLIEKFTKNLFIQGNEGTLLEKAARFREKHPEKWERRESERSKNFELGVSTNDRDTQFLTAYYAERDKLAEEKKIQEQNRKFQIPKLTVSLMFNLPIEIKESLPQSDAYESLFEDFSVFHKDALQDMFSPFKSADDEPELFITVNKGKYLLNRFKEQHKYDGCKLKCTFHPNGSRSSQVRRTKYLPVDNHGKTRWKHVFIVKGHTRDELANSYMTFHVKANGRHQNDYVGNATLSGMNAKVLLEDPNFYREPTDAETVYWHNAIHIPGVGINATLDLSLSTPTSPPKQTAEKPALSNLMKQEHTKPPK